MRKLFFVMGCLGSFSLLGIEIWVENVEGSPFLFDVGEEESLGNLRAFVHDFCALEPEDQEIFLTTQLAYPQNTDAEYQLVVRKSRRAKKEIAHAVRPNEPRDYYAHVATEEKKEIEYIIITLADESYAKLLVKQASLERAGTRVDHIHPLRFVHCIFSDEKMKVGFHNLRKKMFVWDNFLKNMQETFAEEIERDNLTPDMIEAFSQDFQLDTDTLSFAIQQKQWQNFFDILIEKIPRNEEHDRYGM